MTRVADPRAARQGPRRRLHGAPPRCPRPHRRAVGPFVFFDHFGPDRPSRPARTTTSGRIRTSAWRRSPTCSRARCMHRDSTGVVQRIEPGAVNWMSAGRGIVHSERTPEGPARQGRTAATACSSGSRCPRPLEDVGAVVPARPRRARSRACRLDGATVARRRRRGVRRGLAGRDRVADAGAGDRFRRRVSGTPSRCRRRRRASARSTRSTTRSRSTACRSTSARWSCSRRRRRRRSRRRAAAASSSSAASRSAIASCRGTSSPARASGSAPPRTTGARSASRTIPGETEFIPLPERQPPPAGDRTVPGAA